MRQLVAHRGDLPPGDRGLLAEQFDRDVLDGLADLDEAHPNGVEDEAVAERPALQVLGDGRAGLEDVEPVSVAAAHSGTRSRWMLS